MAEEKVKRREKQITHIKQKLPEWLTQLNNSEKNQKYAIHIHGFAINSSSYRRARDGTYAQVRDAAIDSLVACNGRCAITEIEFGDFDDVHMRPSFDHISGPGKREYQVVMKAINSMKSNLSTEQFLALCAYIASKHKEVKTPKEHELIELLRQYDKGAAELSD